MTNPPPWVWTITGLLAPDCALMTYTGTSGLRPVPGTICLRTTDAGVGGAAIPLIILRIPTSVAGPRSGIEPNCFTMASAAGRNSGLMAVISTLTASEESAAADVAALTPLAASAAISVRRLISVMASSIPWPAPTHVTPVAAVKSPLV